MTNRVAFAPTGPNNKSSCHPQEMQTITASLDYTHLQTHTTLLHYEAVSMLKLKLLSLTTTPSLSSSS